MEFKGDCFKVAIENLKNHPNWKFCFGYVYFGVIENEGKRVIKRVLHAWNEDDKFAYDFSSNQKLSLPKNEYYLRRQMITKSGKVREKFLTQDKQQVLSFLRTKNTSGWWCKNLIDELNKKN